MRKLTATLCLTLAVLFVSVGGSWGADFQKGLTAYESGDYATAQREWTPLAEQGHMDAQHKLGNLYYKGNGVPKNNKTAMRWWKYAAQQGNADSQNNLGYMIGNGLGSVKKIKNASVKVKNNYPVKNVLTIERHGSGMSNVWTELILYSTNPTWGKIGTIDKPINQYQATNKLGLESEIVGFYESNRNIYIEELVLRAGYELVCNACRKWDVQTLQLVDKNLLRVNLRPYDIKTYTRYYE
jgi:hypothetical protein